MLIRILTFARELILGTDRALGESLAGRSSYLYMVKFLDTNSDLPCPWCGASGHHEVSCELLARAS